MIRACVLIYFKIGGGSHGLQLFAPLESPPVSESAISLEDSLEANLLI